MVKIRSECEHHDESNRYTEAEKVAWMGWELMNANEAVDIRDWDNYEAIHEVLPLGNFFEEMEN